MSDKYFSITVALDENIREDEIKSIIDAIRMIKHVIEAKPNVANVEIWVADERAKMKILTAILQFIRNDQTDKI